MARIAVVEDHELVARTLAISLRAGGHDVDVVTPGTVETTLARLYELGPDLVLLDLDLGGDLGTAVPLIAPLRASGARVLVVTGNRDDAALGACLEAGAEGVLGKDEPFEHLVDAIEATLAGGPPMRTSRRVELVDALRDTRAATRRRAEPFLTLTAREAEVLAALVEGQSAETVARASFTSVATVRTQIAAILRKLGVSSQLAAVAMTRHAGWPELSHAEY